MRSSQRLARAAFAALLVGRQRLDQQQFVVTRAPTCVEQGLDRVLADLDDEWSTKYGPLAPLTFLALDDVLEGKVPSLLDLESWERRMERWIASAAARRLPAAG